MAKRWRKQPNQQGLARICQGPRGFDLRENGNDLAHVRPVTKDRWKITGWYWYGLGQNTYSEPVETPDMAKAQVMEYIKKNGIGK